MINLFIGSIGVWVYSDPKMLDSFFVHVPTHDKWLQVKNSNVFDTFTFVRFDGDDGGVILKSANKKDFFFKLLDNELRSGESENTAGRHAWHDGQWTVKPTTD